MIEDGGSADRVASLLMVIPRLSHSCMILLLILFPKESIDKTNRDVVYSNRVIKMKKYIITQEEYEAVKAAQKKNIHKRQDKLLEAVALRYEGYTDWEIAYKLGWNRQSVSRMIKRFKREGLEAYVKNNYKGNHRNLSEAEEKAALDEVASLAAQGHLVGVEEIRSALEKRLGRESRTGYVYDVIHRHNWRQVMPRPKHPKAASPEEQETAKKEIVEKFEELKKTNRKRKSV